MYYICPTDKEHVTFYHVTTQQGEKAVFCTSCRVLATTVLNYEDIKHEHVIASPIGEIPVDVREAAIKKLAKDIEMKIDQALTEYLISGIDALLEEREKQKKENNPDAPRLPG